METQNHSSRGFSRALLLGDLYVILVYSLPAYVPCFLLSAFFSIPFYLPAPCSMLPGPSPGDNLRDHPAEDPPLPTEGGLAPGSGDKRNIHSPSGGR